MLLQRGLQLLHHLKLHLQPLPPLSSRDWDYDQMKYANEIQEHPEHHLCNVIREVGQNIKSLDLALPLVCSQIFLPQPSKGGQDDRGELRFPVMPREPAETLPARVMAEGCRYRRLICWDGFCRDGGKWEEMQDLASLQGEGISWEITSAQDECSSWHLSGCLPVMYSSDAVLERELAENER